MRPNERLITCCLCGDIFREGQGNNPWPVAKKGECCSKCNTKQVIPARLRQMKEDTHDK